MRVDQPVDGPFDDVGDLGQRDAEKVRRERQRLAVEVAAGDHLALVGEHQRVVGGGVDLDGHDLFDVGERVHHGAVDLRDAAERVGVLDLFAIGVRSDDAAAGDDPPHVGRTADLPGVRACGVDFLVEDLVRAAEGFEAHAPGDLGALDEAGGLGDQQTAQGGHHLRAVDQRQPFLGRQRDGLDAGLGQYAGRRDGLAVDETLALAHQHQRQMRQRGQIAAGPDRALRRDVGCDVAVEQLAQHLDQLGPNAGKPLGQRVGPKHHHRADNAAVQRIADADGMAAYEV